MNSDIKNIIIISIDNLRSDCIKINPNKKLLEKYKLTVELKTPIMDWFINNGVFFNQCITVAPYTTVAHASILTGQWPIKHRIIGNNRNKLASPTIFKILKKRGFMTLFQTDFPYILGPNFGFTNGIDKFTTKEEESLEWLKKNSNRPLACFFHFANVHEPYGFFNLFWGGDDYKKKVTNLLNKYNIKPDNMTRESIDYSIRDFNFEEKLLMQNYRKIINRMHGLGLYNQIMDLYIEGINYFEKKRFNSFLKKIKEISLLNDSLIVILGDHGEIWDKYNKGHGNAKISYINSLADDVIKVPLIFFGPNLPKNLIIDSQVRTIDIVPTILSILGYKREKANLDGYDLSLFKNLPQELTAYSQYWHAAIKSIPIFLNKDKSGKEILSKSDFYSYLALASIRKKKWKLIQSYSKDKKILKTKLFNIDDYKIELFNKNNIKKALNEKLTKYNDMVYKYIGEGEIISDIEHNEIADQLKSLGYNI